MQMAAQNKQTKNTAITQIIITKKPTHEQTTQQRAKGKYPIKETNKRQQKENKIKNTQRMLKIKKKLKT